MTFTIFINEKSPQLTIFELSFFISIREIDIWRHKLHQGNNENFRRSIESNMSSCICLEIVFVQEDAFSLSAQWLGGTSYFRGLEVEMLTPGGRVISLNTSPLLVCDKKITPGSFSRLVSVPNNYLHSNEENFSTKSFSTIFVPHLTYLQ